MQELECWKTLAATEVAEVVFAAEVQERNGKPDEKSSLFDSGTLSMIEVLSGKPEESYEYSWDIHRVEKVRMRVLLKIASLSCSKRHVEYLYHLELQFFTIVAFSIVENSA